MRIIITENQYNLLTEQSNVYTDEVKYERALKVYNKKMEIYEMLLELYNAKEKWSKDNIYTNPAFNTVNMVKLSKIMGVEIGDIPFTMDRYYKCINNILDYQNQPGTNCGFYIDAIKKLGNIKIEKWVKVNFGFGGKIKHTTDAFYNWIIKPKDPNLQKPIFKKPEPVVKPTPPITKTPPLINYKEVISNVTTFGTPYKTGTPLIELNIPGGPYYLTYPEFETYKKSRPNTTFKKI